MTDSVKEEDVQSTVQTDVGSAAEKPRMPSSIPFIITNEMTERFTFYGMKSILMIYMITYLGMSAAEGAEWGHWFMGMLYLFPFFGAILADGFLGKYRVIFWLSIVYCFGPLIMALPVSMFGGDPKIPLFWGLLLIALGAGGIKSCTSALVGDQFTAKNESLVNQVFGWFYMAINAGSFIAMLAMPLVLKHYGPHVAFGIPGILMMVATLILWSGRKRYIHIPAKGSNVITDLFSKEGGIAVAKVMLVFVFLIIFWCVFDQTAFRWVAQAKEMNAFIFKDITWLPEGMRNFQMLPEHIQVVNPLCVLLLIPIFTCVIYPLIDRFYKLTILRKIAWGFVMSILASIIPFAIQLQLDKTAPVTEVAQVEAPAAQTENAEAQPAADAQPAAEATPEAGADAQPAAEVAPEAVADAQPAAEVAPEAVADAQPAAEVAPEAVADAQPAAEASPEAGADAQPAAEVAPEAVADAQPAAEASPEAGADAQPAAATEAAQPDPAVIAASMAGRPNLAWQVIAYVLLTIAEVLVSVTSLEFAYTQAPRSMKTLVMGLYFFTMTCANFILSYVNRCCEANPDFLSGADYFRFFLIISVINAAIFFVVIKFYKPKTYMQEEMN